MASAKSFEDMLLSSDIDESAVSALVGSLESQLSSDAHYPRNDLPSAPINNNHIANPTAADCAVRIADGQKHGALLGSLLEQGGSNKTTHIMGLNTSPGLPANAVIVSMAGALPACRALPARYLNQVSTSQQQALLNSSARQVTSGDIKLVFSSPSAFFSSAGATLATSIAQINPSNFKVVQNGSPSFTSTGQQVVTVSGPISSCSQTSTAATLSAMQNLANIASAQPRIQVIGGQPQINAISAPESGSPVGQQADGKGKPLATGSNNIQSTAVVDQRLSPSVVPNHYQVLSGQTSVIASKSNPAGPGQPVNVVTQVVTNPNMLPHGVQILNVNPARFGQKTLAPRSLVMGNQVRIAPQVIRQGTPQNAIALPAGMQRAIVVRADGSQYHVLNVAPPGFQAGASSAPNSTYRLQSLPAGVPGLIRTISPQVVSVPVTSATVKTMPSPQTVVSTVLQPTTTTATPRNNIPTNTQSTTNADHYYTGYKYNDYFSNNSMSPNTIKKKCQNFLSTLIKLAGDQTSKTANNVKRLIQNLIDGVIEPEEFATQLQKELRSSPQPYLIHFLKKSLPHVRQSLMTKEITIDGIRPPPLPTPIQISSSSPMNMIGAIRPTVSHAGRTIMTSVAGSALTAQLSQAPGGTILTQRLIAPSVPQGSKIIRPQMFTTLGSTASSGLMESSPATLTALQSKLVAPKQASILKTLAVAKEKKTFVSSVRDEDDINDVAAMGGVNLLEESQRILATNSELVGTQIRSCKDENHFLTSALHRRVMAIAKRHGLEEVRNDVVELVSHAAEQRLKDLLERLSLVAEHRIENPKNDPRYEVTSDTRAQIKFLEELDKLEKKRHDDQEKEILIKAAKSRSKVEDPELLKLKQKAKEMQRAEIEEMRQREANMTALLAIGPRKKLKTDNSSSSNPSGTGDSTSSSTFKTPLRPRKKRVYLRDLLFVMENEQQSVRRPLLYKYYSR